MRQGWSYVLGLTAILLVGTATLSAPSQATPNQSASIENAAEDGREVRRFLMNSVASWGYQLQRLDVRALAASPFDLLVIDHAPDRVDSVELLFRRSEIELLQSKPGGGRRVVLAYVSIGEAERYRFYWDDKWLDKDSCPVWMGPVNPQWAGNYPVQYWQDEWQALMFGKSDSYVDRVLNAGFDGIYLDRADVYEQFKDRPSAQADMVAFMARLIDHARSIKPDAIVVLQNAEELLRQSDVLTRLDGVAKESLYFNADKGGEAMPLDEQVTASKDLKRLQRAGGKVMVVEYVDSAERAAIARNQAQRDGFLVHFAERTLATLNLHGPDEAPVMANLSPPQIPASTAPVSPQFVRPGPCG